MSEEPWEIPDTWEWVELSKIAEINPQLPLNDIPDELEVSFIPMANVEEETGNFNLSETRKYKDVKSGYTKFSNGDIIFAKITPCMENGKIAIVDDLKNSIGFGSTEFHVIRLKSDTLSKKFYFYFFLQKWFRVIAEQNFTGTVGHRRVPTSFMREVLIPLPPKKEQIQIIDRIEELLTRDEFGQKTLQKIQKQLENYKQSLLNYAFTGKLTKKWRKKELSIDKETYYSEYSDLDPIPESWDRINVHEIEEFLGSGITPRGGRKNYQDQGIPFIRSQNVYSEGLILDDIAYVTKELHEKMSRTHVQEKDVLLNITGASIGRSTYIPKDLGEGNVNQHVCIIRTKKEFNPIYISWYLNSPEGQYQIMSKQSGQTRQGLNYSQLRSIKIPLPKLLEQNIIAEKIENILSLLNTLNKEIDETINRSYNLKQSILKRAFEGRLVPQDPDDEPARVLLGRIKLEKQGKVQKRLI
jgi:type I restriction enzyme S subunit